jgi:hypothetical protein
MGEGLTTRRKMLLLAATILMIAAGGVISLTRTLRGPGAIAEQREQLQLLRVAVDSCHLALAQGQGELLAYNARLDSMLARVRGMEALHPRGVPADSYSTYMDNFEQYNDSVAAWGDRVESLQAEREACVELTAEHNEAQDSLRTLLLQQRR